METLINSQTDPVAGLLAEMETGLERIAREHADLLARTRESGKMVKKILDRLKATILEGGFPSRQEEIRFFKIIKPQFVSQLIYHCRMHLVLASQPVFKNRIREDYLIRQLTRIEYFIRKHRAFYQYMKNQEDHLDGRYFVRGAEEVDLSMDDYFFNADNRFSTGYDYIQSCFMAYERLGLWITSELQGLPSTAGLRKPPVSQLSWTGSKTAMIELIYGLQTSGVFNNGTADIKQIASCFEQLFDMDLGGYYRTFQELRLRKKNRTLFLDQMKEKLLARMDEIDAHPIRKSRSRLAIK